ncbi:hypothetical protein Hanom_Chr08g00705601 [Helianthus anomalus]
MAPGKDNLADSVSVLTQRQLDKFIREYRIPLDLNPVLPSKDEAIYPFRQGKFPLYTRVVLRYFRVHLCQVNPFGLSRINHFEISCRALNQRPDLDVFRYFYEFITTGDWFTFAHRKGVPSPSEDERSGLKNWKDIFSGWTIDAFRWKWSLIENQSPIRPLPEHLLLWGRDCFSEGRGDRDWPVIRTKRENALKVPNFNVLDFDFDEQAEGEFPFMKQVASAAQKIRPLAGQGTSEPSAADATSSVPKPSKGAAGSSGSQAKKSILDYVDSDPKVRSLDEALRYHPSTDSFKSKGISSDVELKGLIRKRKTEVPQIRSSNSLPMPKTKKTKKSSSHTSDNVILELDEHLSGGKSSREEAALACSAPTPAFFGGYLSVNEAENMEIEDQGITSKGDGKTQSEPKMVTFSGMILDSSLGPDCFIDDEEDQFVPEWDIRNKDSVMDDLIARTFLFNISTPLDHARSRKMKNQDLGAAVLSNQAQSNVYVTVLYRRWVEAESVRENLEKETLSLKRKIQRTPDVETKLAKLSQDLQAQKEKVKSLITQNQSSQATAASTSEERDKIIAQLRGFAESTKKKDKEHKEVLSKMEETVSNAHAMYEIMLAERDALKTGEAELKTRIEEMKDHHRAEIEELKLENANLEAKVEDLQATKAWLLS